MKKGVFWIVDGRLLAFPFGSSFPEGTAKSGDTYNHCLLWPYVRSHGSIKAFDYYPRGRVDVKNGHAVVYMSPHIDKEGLPVIMEAFALSEPPTVKLDYSRHYRCHLDRR